MKRAGLSLVIVAIGALQAVAAPPTIYNLGTLPGTYSQGYAVNDRGQVAGTSGHAFLYIGTPGSGGAMADLGTLGGMSNGSEGRDINAAGQVVGYSDTSDGVFHAFLYTGTPGSGGAMADLGTLPGGLHSYANGINDSGQVVGFGYHINTLGLSEASAFLYTGTPGSGGVMHDLGTLGGTESSAAAINDSGKITGGAQTSSGVAHAFLYTGTPGVNGQMIDLGTLSGGSSSGGAAINTSGQVAGAAYTPNGRSRAFLYTGTPGVDGQMFDLGTLPGMFDSGGSAINDRGQVAGYSQGVSAFFRRAFLYTGTPGVDGQMIDLDAWLDANNPTEGAKWQLNAAHALSNTGLITGDGFYNDGPGGLTDGSRDFLLDASALVVPEPASAILLAIAGLAMLARRRPFAIGSSSSVISNEQKGPL